LEEPELGAWRRRKSLEVVGGAWSLEEEELELELREGAGPR